MQVIKKTLYVSSTAIFASVFSDVWKAEVVSPVEALVSSCVVLPCKFSYPGTRFSDSRIKGIWHKQTDRNDRIYDEDHHLIGDNFKGRTKLVGRLSEKNCSLEIDDVKDHDDGPFCFRAELPADQKFSFVEKCVTITMKREFGFEIYTFTIFLNVYVPFIYRLRVKGSSSTCL